MWLPSHNCRTALNRLTWTYLYNRPHIITERHWRLIFSSLLHKPLHRWRHATKKSVFQQWGPASVTQPRGLVKLCRKARQGPAWKDTNIPKWLSDSKSGATLMSTVHIMYGKPFARSTRIISEMNIPPTMRPQEFRRQSVTCLLTPPPVFPLHLWLCTSPQHQHSLTVCRQYHSDNTYYRQQWGKLQGGSAQKYYQNYGTHCVVQERQWDTCCSHHQWRNDSKCFDLQTPESHPHIDHQHHSNSQMVKRAQKRFYLLWSFKMVILSNNLFIVH